MIYAVYRIDYTEIEGGWGSRPDGFILATSKEWALGHKQSYESRNTWELSQVGTDPELIEVSQEIYDVVASKNVIWDNELKRLGLKL